MATGNGELMHECFPKHLRMGSSKNEIRQRKEVKKRCVSMERSKAGTKNEVLKPQIIAQAYLPPGWLRPETVDEFPN